MLRFTFVTKKIQNNKDAIPNVTQEKRIFIGKNICFQEQHNKKKKNLSFERENKRIEQKDQKRNCFFFYFSKANK